MYKDELHATKELCPLEAKPICCAVCRIHTEKNSNEISGCNIIILNRIDVDTLK